MRTGSGVETPACPGPWWQDLLPGTAAGLLPAWVVLIVALVIIRPRRGLLREALDDAGLRSTRSVLLRARGLEPCGDGLEQSDQLAELQRLQSVVGGFGEGVGQ